MCSFGLVEAIFAQRKGGYKSTSMTRESPARRVSASPGSAARLERAQEGDELVLLGGAKAVEIVGHGLCLAKVPLNGVIEGGAAAVVQQLSPSTHSPKWRRAHFVCGFLAAGLNNAVTGPDVVQQEIAVRMDDLVAQRSGYDERSRSQSRACWRGGDRRNVAEIAADAMEETGTSHTVRRSGKGGVAGWCFGGAYESRETIDVLQALGIRGVIVGIGNHVANPGHVHIVGRQTIADAHLVQIGVAGKGEKRGVLVLPSEAADG